MYTPKARKKTRAYHKPENGMSSTENIYDMLVTAFPHTVNVSDVLAIPKQKGTK